RQEALVRRIRGAVGAGHQGRGIGRQLLAAIGVEARRTGLTRLITEASITAGPFFEAQGFKVVAPQVVTCRGAEFVNYRMERVLAEPPGPLVGEGRTRDRTT